jgi:YggT family protein
VGLFFGNLLQIAVLALLLLIFARVILSWVDPGNRSGAAVFVYRTTEPILGPVRRALPSTGAVDLSPMVVLIVLTVLLRLF